VDLLVQFLRVKLAVQNPTDTHEGMDMPLLHNGDAFPHLELPAVGGGKISLPGDLAGAFSVVLVYRGSWCPYCRAQLASFARAWSSLVELGIRVVALSVDDEATSTALVDRHHLPFPVGHSADPDTVAAATGAYTSTEPRYLQSTGFVLAPDGSVVTAVYSSAAIGRLVAEDVLGLVRYEQSHG
jgi:peroxiredoxin